MSKRDWIAVVEACYDLEASDGEWMQRLAAAMHELRCEPELGTVAYHIAVDPPGLRLENVVQVGGNVDFVRRLQAMNGVLERRARGTSTVFERVQSRVYEGVVHAQLRVPADQMLMTELHKVGPDWMYTLGVPKVRDAFFLVSHHIDGLGGTLVASGLTGKGSVDPAERRLFQMLSAHIKSGMRLRRRLRAPRESVDAPEGGAVLDPSGHVVHAEGEAREPDAREELRRMARNVDSARSSKGRTAEALAIWYGLVDGRWSLVDRYDADGRRYLLAHRNPENVTDPRGLTDLELRVARLAVRGYANRKIAYHLGINENSVTTHLHQAMRKLRVADRFELVRTLGTDFPRSTEPRVRA